MTYRQIIRRASCLTLIFMMASTNWAKPASLVIVKSQASEEFSIAREQHPSEKVMTYSFMKGRFHPGRTKDSSMDEFAFNELAIELATHLKRQDFLPAPDPNNADLLIVVHYGVTSVQDSWEDLQGYTSMKDYGFGDGAIASGGLGGGSVDVSSLNAISDMQFQVNSEATVGDSNQSYTNYMARLIGMEKAYSDNIGPSEEHFLKALLDEERYFIVLMAYHFPKLREGEVNLQWITRYSVRALGQAYGDALKDMNLVAGDYFGKNLGDIVKKRVTDTSRVQLGELEVIGTEDSGEEDSPPPNR